MQNTRRLKFIFYKIVEMLFLSVFVGCSLIPDVPHQLVLNSAFINRTKINLRRSCNSLNFDAEYEKT